MSDQASQESIAIVGMAGRFPQAKNLAEFWRNLREGRECISFFKDEPLQWLPIEHPPKLDDPRYVRARGVLEKPEWFDAAFFGMNPKEAEVMDPQHRVFLECAWEALEDAGCNPETFDGLIGVFAGASMNTYLLTNLITNRDLIADFGMFSAMIMNDGDFVPTRVSYKLNLRGPSINVQTACSTSLVAVALAAQNLLGYRCDVALAGGVSITFPPHRGQFHLEGGILSKDGHCRAFDAQASGTVLGDGCGIVVLKRLTDALNDGDRILAVIKGTAINNDGSVKIGYTAPSVDGQAEVIAMAQAEAGFAPETVSYIEAHGTGTPLGDPIEIAGLTKAFGLDGSRGQFCAVGSVKSNLGHLDIGAGVAGLIKTVLALQHSEIPPSLHFGAPNPKIDFANSPFFVNAALRPWQRNGTPRRAGVSSFGIGGTNAHVAIEEAPQPEPTSPSRSKQLLVLSAKTPTALEAMTENLATHLENGERNLADIAWTLQAGRKVFGHRRALVCESVADAIAALRSKDARRVVTGGAEEAAPSVAFMFPGQGAQTINMARELYETEAGFRATVERCCEILRSKLGEDLREILFPVGAAGAASCPDQSRGKRAPTASELLSETRITQPALFVIEYALAQLWLEWGVKPAAMIGHSLGEYVAATMAGVFSLEDALALVAERARLMQAQPPGAMLAIRRSEAEVAPLLEGNLALAAVNAPGLCVVSGPFDAIEAAEKRLAASAIASKRLATSHAFHSPMMEPVLRPFAECVRQLKLHAPKLLWVSNVTGQWITDEQATSADYWVTHLRQTVRFADGVATLMAAGHRVLLEVGPGHTLAGLAKQHPAVAGESATSGAATIIASLAKNGEAPASDLAAMLRALGELWVAGIVPNWREGFYRNERRRIVSLPTYPFERKRYWIEPGIKFGDDAAANAKAEHDAKVERIVPNALGRNGAEIPSALGTTRSISSVEESATITALKHVFHELSGLDLARASVDASFYQLGFDSLFLTQASLAVARRFGVEVTFRQLREDLQTLAKLAAHIDGSSPARERSTANGATLSSPVVHTAGHEAREKRIPLTNAQREMWFASQLGSAVSSAYNESSTLQLDGPLEVDALHRALRQLVARHEALRTTFLASGEFQLIAATGDIPLPLHDFSAERAEVRAARIAECIDAEAQRSFDLVSGPLFRAALVRVEPESHRLVLVVHHIICDGWSLGIMIRELGELYSAETSRQAASLAPAPLFSDYAAKQSAVANTPEFSAAEKFWQAQFADDVPVLDLPTDRARPAHRSYAGSFLLATLSPEVTAALKRLCVEHDCTTFTALLAAFNVLLHRLTGQDDVVVGVPSAAQVMDGLENLVGHFANLLPIRSRVTEDERFSDYLAAVRQHMTTALEHWRYPFSTLLQQLNLPRDSSRVPLAPVVFNTTRRRGTLHFAGLHAEVASNPKRFVNFDLNFNFAVTDDTISLGCYYSTELFDEATIRRWFGHFENLLRAITAEPSARLAELPLLTAAERNQMLIEWNNTALPYRADACIHTLFEEQAQRTPAATAMIAGHERLTYAELNRRADVLATALRAASIGPDVLAGIFLERGANLVTAMLGVLKAGGAYVPLDPAHPTQRLALVIEDARMPVIVTQRDLARYLPETNAKVVVMDEVERVVPHALGGNGSVSPARTTRPSAENLAYVIYTSGSTGQPKGVCLEHRGVVALAAWAEQFYSREELDGVLFATSATFDVSVFEWLVPLCLGGKIIVAENILELPTIAAADDVRLISGVPSAVAELVRSRRIPGGVRTVNVAGEPCPQSLVESLYALPHIGRVVDVYGPTETTVYSTGSIRQKGGRATIGRPLPNERAYLLDRRQRPVPIGVRGELYIGGDKLARGYLNRPELTREKFVEVEFLPGVRLYRTGDGARFLPDGSIEFLGRLDHQVKIRGYRIELGEIESTLAKHAAVSEAAVIARAEPNGSSQRLIAYVVPAPGASVTARELRDHLLKVLPDYMVPPVFVLLEALPRTTSGKVDRKALPEPEVSGASASHTPPRSTTEELLVEIWRDVLGLSDLGIHDNFFELGGHSLLATQVIARIHDSLGVELSMRQFFVAPTVAGMAPAIEAALIEEIKATVDDDAATAGELATAKE